MREYKPKLESLDGLFELELTNPDYRPVEKFVVRHGRRHKYEEVARRDGAVCEVPGPLKPLDISVSGMVGNADWAQNDTIRDTLSHALMSQEEEFYLYRFSDRRAKVRLVGAEWPANQLLPLAEYSLAFVALDPYWYATSDTSATREIVINDSTGISIEIAGTAPTPVKMHIEMPPDAAPAGSSVITLEDVGLNARTGRGYWEFGDSTCSPNVGGTIIDYDPAERTIDTDNADCTNALEHFRGYFFDSGPGETTFRMTSTGETPWDGTASVTFTWTSRWYLP